MASVPGLWIDWDGTGFGTSVNGDCTALLVNAQYQRGGTPEITGAAQAGSGTFTLLNPDGLFDPDNASSPLYGLLKDGVPVWFGLNEDGTLEDKSAPVHGRFAGRILTISPIPQAGAGDSTPTAEIVCEDALGWYSRVFVALGDDCSPGPSPTANPIHAWSLWETSGPAVDLIADEDGTYVDGGGQTRGVDGPPIIPDSKGLESDGSVYQADYVILDDVGEALVHGNDDRSVEWSFRYGSTFLGSAFPFEYGVPNDGVFRIEIAANDPVISVGGGPLIDPLTHPIDTAAFNGDWHYGCVTYRGATRTVSVYLDEVLQWTDTFPSPIDTLFDVDTGYAKIAINAPLQTYAQSCTAIYNRVLSAGEIIQHANGVYSFVWS